MPGMDGIEAAARIREELPGVRTIIVTTFDRPGYLRRALDAGVIGFVVKTTPARVWRRRCDVPSRGCGPWIRHWPTTSCSPDPTR